MILLQNKYKLFIFFIVFILIASLPALTISLIKSDQSDNIGNISYLKYQEKSSIVLYNIGNGTNSQQVLVYQKNFTSCFTLSFIGNKTKFSDTTTGVNLSTLIDIIYSDTPTFPSDPLNNHTVYQNSDQRLEKSPYNSIFGFISVTKKTFVCGISDNNLKTPSGGHPIYGSATMNIMYAPLKNGNLMCRSNSFVSFNGVKSIYNECIQNKSYSALYDLLGGTTIFLDVASHSNNSEDFILSAGSTITLISTNVQFVPIISHYIEYGILTGSIFLVACTLYFYGRSRKWNVYQSMFFPLLGSIMMMIFILPYTYVYYLL